MKTPIICKFKRRIICKPPKINCLWGFSPPSEISKCFDCPNYIRDDELYLREKE